jgi:hypothetical protein
MIERIRPEQYVNCIELSWIFAKREFFTAMEFLQFYDQEERSWELRPVAWYAASVAVSSAFLSTFAPLAKSVLLSAFVAGAFTRLLQVSRWK